MKLKFYGVRGGFFRPTRKYLFQNLISTTVNDGKNILLLDAGSKEIAKDKELSKVENILLTHTHLDHILHLGKIVKKTEMKPTIYSPQRLPPRFKLQTGNFNFSTKIPETIGNFKIEFLRTKHARICYSYKISSKGKTVCFTGDTRYFKELADFSRGVDVLVCESTLTDNHRVRAYIRGHMRPSTVIKLAKEAEPKLLVLTHFNKLSGEEFLNEVKKGFPNAICAYEGMELFV